MSKHWKLFLDNVQHYICTAKKGRLIAWVPNNNRCHFHRSHLYPDTMRKKCTVDKVEVVSKFGKKDTAVHQVSIRKCGDDGTTKT